MSASPPFYLLRRSDHNPHTLVPTVLMFETSHVHATICGIKSHRLFPPILFLVAAVTACLVLWAVAYHELLHTPPPPAVTSEANPYPRKAQHLALVVLDGLRHDIVTDAARAPNLARRMRAHSHGALWAGKISMTSSAIFAIGAGQRAHLAHVITNVSSDRSPYEDLFNNARKAGLRTVLIGDRGWAQMYGDFDAQTFEPAGAAIEYDDSPEIFAGANREISKDSLPDILVVHFLATDHQAHAYGTASQRYTSFLRGFDNDFERFLTSIPPSTTVFVFSDHGTTDTGAHGSDTPVQRKGFLFAYGPGIRPGVEIPDIDQVDLGPTLAVLLGMPPPVHGRGAALVEVLDLNSDEAAAVSCADARRTARYALALQERELAASIQKEAAACESPGSAPTSRVLAARSAVRHLDRALDGTTESRSKRGAHVASVCLIAFMLVLTWATRRAAGHLPKAKVFGLYAAALGVCVSSVYLTLHVERIQAPYHNVVRAVLLILCNGALLFGLLRPSRGADFFARFPAISLALLPGALAVSYTANTQVMSLVVLAVACVLWFFAAHADLREHSWLWKGSGALPVHRVAIAFTALVFLVPFAIRQDNPHPAFIMQHTPVLFGAIFAGLMGLIVSVSNRLNARTWMAQIAPAVAIAFGALIHRRHVPSIVGLPAAVIFPVLCIAAVVRGHWPLATALGVASYAWVSRDIEVLPVIAAAIVLASVGHAYASKAPALAPPTLERPWAVAGLVSILFAATYLSRVGLQIGLDFPGLDFGCGVFQDPNASVLRVTLCCCWKYAVVQILLLIAFLPRLDAQMRRTVARVFVAIMTMRAATITWMLFVCSSSYWSAYRTLSDLPTVLLEAAAAAVVALAIEVRPLSERLEASVRQGSTHANDRQDSANPLGVIPAAPTMPQ